MSVSAGAGVPGPDGASVVVDSNPPARPAQDVVLVPPGAMQQRFVIHTDPVSSPIAVPMSASHAGTTVLDALLVEPAPQGAQAHHVFPQRLADKLRSKLYYINVHDPRLGAWWDAGEHGRRTQEYDDDFTRLLRQSQGNRDLLIELVRDLAKEKYGLKVYF